MATSAASRCLAQRLAVPFLGQHLPFAAERVRAKLDRRYGAVGHRLDLGRHARRNPPVLERLMDAVLGKADGLPKCMLRSERGNSLPQRSTWGHVRTLLD